jgi:ABC-2 type transport system permease protein
MTGLAALTERVLVNTRRDLDLVFAVLTPVAALVGLTVVLRKVIDTGGMSYTQYVLPAVIIQAIVFGSMTTADRAARDAASGFGVRLGTMPISAAVPLMARMSYCIIRGGLCLVTALIAAYAMGYRMTGGFLHSLAFVVIGLMLTLTLSLGADAVGTRFSSWEAASQLLFLPQLLLVLLSTGLAPVDAFPDWIQPFVDYQPVSQVAETMRNFAGGIVDMGNLAMTLAWCTGLLVLFGALAVRMQRRTA